MFFFFLCTSIKRFNALWFNLRVLDWSLVSNESLTFSCFFFIFQINELSHVQIPIMLMPDDFKAYSKIKVDNHLFNKYDLL